MHQVSTRHVKVERSWTAAREQQRRISLPDFLLSNDASEWLWMAAVLFMSHLICFIIGWTLRGWTRGPCEPGEQNEPLPAACPADVVRLHETSNTLTPLVQSPFIPKKEAEGVEEHQDVALRERPLVRKRGVDISPMMKSSRRGLIKRAISSSSPALVIKVDQEAIRSLALPLVALARCFHSLGQSLESISHSLRSSSEAKSAIQRQAMWCRCFRFGLWILLVTLVISSVKGGRVATVFRSCQVGGGPGGSSKAPVFKWPWSMLHYSASLHFISRPGFSGTSIGRFFCICHGLGLHALGIAIVWQLLLPLLRHSGRSGSIIMGFSSNDSSQLEAGDLILDLGVGFGIIGSSCGAYLTSCLGGSWPVFTTLWTAWLAYLAASISAEAAGVMKEATSQGTWSRFLQILVLSSLLPILIGSLPFLSFIRI